MGTGKKSYLEWSIKLSLLMYATTSPGGGIKTEGVESENGLFLFPKSDDTEGYKFEGSVAVFAHYGMPITTFAELELLTTPDGNWALLMSPDGGPAVIAFDLGKPHIAEDGMEFAEVRLTQLGSDMFGGYYDKGEEFDPIRFVTAQ